MLTDAELVQIWERGAIVYYDDHLAFARAVCAAQREQWKDLAVAFKKLDELAFDEGMLEAAAR